MKGKVNLKDLLKVIAATLVLFVTVESLLRIAYGVRNSMVEYVPLPYNAGQGYGPIPPWVDDLRILKRDETLLWRTRPMVNRRYMDVYSPVHVEEERNQLLIKFLPTIPPDLSANLVWEISINSAGYRDEEFSIPKPSTVFRIISLGDSWTFGANVGQEQTYPHRLETLLRQEYSSASFEVYNLGVLGYSSNQGLKLMQTLGFDLNPDLVTIGFGMNDASVVGWRDKDAQIQKEPLAKRAGRLFEFIESYKLLRYLTKSINHKPLSLGDYMQNMADAVGTSAESWTGMEASESVDYQRLEPYVRVSPKDYEQNIVEMIDLARSHEASVILLYNELWSTPYRTVLEKISKAKGVPLVDSQALMDQARTRIEDDLEEQLDLRPSQAKRGNRMGEVEVIFRVYTGKYAVPKAMFIDGPHPKLGEGVPNQVTMYDDGTHGDQRADDEVWSYAETFSHGTKLFYVYTNSGQTGRWEGLDIPDIRRFTVDALNEGERVYRPIETFGEMYMQADVAHTNAIGYELIAQGLLKVLSKHEKVLGFLGKIERNQN